MPRIFKTTMLLLAALLLCALSAAAAEFSADVVISAGGRQMTSKMYSKGNKQRMEMNTPGGQMINIIDFKSGKMFTLMPAQKMYIEHQGLDNNSLKQIEAMRAGKTPANAKRIGSEKVAGYSTDVYLVKDPKAGEAKVWYSPKLMYPIKSEGQGPMGKHSMTLSNIKEGGVSGSMFQVPAGYHKFQMPKGVPGGSGMPGGGMPGGMGGGMGGTRGQ